MERKCSWQHLKEGIKIAVVCAMATALAIGVLLAFEAHVEPSRAYASSWSLPVNMSKCTMKLSSKIFTYNGKIQKPTVTVSLFGFALEQDRSYSLRIRKGKSGYTEAPIDAGNYTVTAEGQGLFTGSKSMTYSIVKAPISDVEVANIKAKTYEGKAIKVQPKLTYAGSELESGVDYSVSYSSNTKPGTAQIKVRGKGNFTGTRSVSFKINPPALGSVVVSGKFKYKLLTSSNSGGTAAVIAFTSRSSRSATVPEKIAIGSLDYKLTAIKTGTFDNAKALTTLTIKTKALTKKSVAGCLRGTALKKIKVPASCVADYKAYFAMSNSGKDVSVIAI